MGPDAEADACIAYSGRILVEFGTKQFFGKPAWKITSALSIGVNCMSASSIALALKHAPPGG